MQDELIELLGDLPASQRQYWKGRVVRELRRRQREGGGTADIAEILRTVETGRTRKAAAPTA